MSSVHMSKALEGGGEVSWFSFDERQLERLMPLFRLLCFDPQNMLFSYSSLLRVIFSIRYFLNFPRKIRYSYHRQTISYPAPL